MPSSRPASPFLCVVLALGACTATPRIVAPFDSTEVTFGQLVERLRQVDVVVLGEVHDDAQVHAMHRRILEELCDRRGDVVVSMEMFERDVQSTLLQYLSGDIDDSEFQARSRPWSNYATDYRPIIELARARHLEVLAANAPRELSKKVSERGLGALPESPFVAAAVSAPDDDYWVAFRAEMQGHVGADDGDKLWRYYEAQCLKDDTMAETIARHLQQAHAAGRRPLVVHFCGHFHSDHRRGTVERLQTRMPDLRILVLGVESVPAGHEGTIAAPPSLADYVLLVPARSEGDAAVAAAPAARRAAAAPTARTPAPGADRAANRDQGGGDAEAGPRAGLGLMPDYGAEADGCTVAEVRADGPADKAGIQAGDLIVRLGEVDVFDVQSYADALSELHPGDRVTVILRRAEAVLHLPVVVGSRNR